MFVFQFKAMEKKETVEDLVKKDIVSVAKLRPEFGAETLLRRIQITGQPAINAIAKAAKGGDLTAIATLGKVGRDKYVEIDGNPSTLPQLLNGIAKNATNDDVRKYADGAIDELNHQIRNIKPIKKS